MKTMFRNLSVVLALTLCIAGISACGGDKYADVAGKYVLTEYLYYRSTNGTAELVPYTGAELQELAGEITVEASGKVSVVEKDREEDFFTGEVTIKTTALSGTLEKSGDTLTLTLKESDNDIIAVVWTLKISGNVLTRRWIGTGPGAIGVTDDEGVENVQTRLKYTKV